MNHNGHNFTAVFDADTVVVVGDDGDDVDDYDNDDDDEDEDKKR